MWCFYAMQVQYAKTHTICFNNLTIKTMQNLKTTITGYVLALLLIAQPILDGSGYTFNKATIGKLLMAIAIVVFGHHTQDATPTK